VRIHFAVECSLGEASPVNPTQEGGGAPLIYLALPVLIMVKPAGQRLHLLTRSVDDAPDTVQDSQGLLKSSLEHGLVMSASRYRLGRCVRIYSDQRLLVGANMRHGMAARLRLVGPCTVSHSAHILFGLSNVTRSLMPDIRVAARASVSSVSLPLIARKWPRSLPSPIVVRAGSHFSLPDMHHILMKSLSLGNFAWREAILGEHVPVTRF